MTIPTVTPYCFVTAGPLQIWTNTAASNVFEYLGDTKGGARITEQTFNAELKSDISGGEPGPPADWQLLGELHQIELELARYTETVLAKLEARVNTGSTRSKGMLIGCSGAQFKVVLIGSGFVRKYTNVFIIEPIDRSPIGTLTQYPRLVLTGLEDASNVVSSGNGVPYAASPYTTAVTVGSNSVA